MKIIDKYLVKQFTLTILFGIVAFTALFVLIDLMEKLDDFIDQDVQGKLIIEYYIMFVPEIVRLILPIAVLLACLFTVGKMSTQNELAAIKSSGVSLYRLMVPFIITGFIISMLSIAFGGYIVPEANKQRVFIEQKYLKKGIVSFGSKIIFQDSDTRIINIFSYSSVTQQANRVTIQDFEQNDYTKIISRIDANSMKFDTTKNSWTLLNGVKRIFNDTNEVATKFIEMELTELNFKPKDVLSKQQKPEELTLDELDELAKERIKAGNDPTRIKIEYHSRFAFAFASLIVVFFGLPISANKRKGGLALQFGISLLFTFLYLVFMKISQAFGKNGVLDPIITAWFANLVFLSVGIINLIKVQK